MLDCASPGVVHPSSTESDDMPAFPNGHFYSPVIDPQELHSRKSSLWSPRVPDPVAIDYRPAEQERLLRELGRYAADFDYPETETGRGFFQHNGKFEGLDARLWFGLLRHLAPARVIEVGSGFTTLLAADVIGRFLGGRTRLTCIEPYPPPFLGTVPGIELIEAPVQSVPVARFEDLADGDVLFIDSSHVSKTGSDVNYLYFDVVPRLAEGVILHIHDIFLPDEYPADWVLNEERSWNEQYVVQAMLMYSYGLEVLIASHYASSRLGDAVAESFGLHCGGGSLWLRKVVPSL